MADISSQKQLGDWREDCGYDKIFKYKVEWQSGPKEPWEDVGINSSVLDNLNNNCPCRFGWHFDVVGHNKIAYITFEDRREAGKFALLRENYR